LLGKRFELLKEIVPAASKVGFPLTLDDASHLPALRSLERAARIQGITVQSYPFRDAGELAEAFRRMREDGIDALIVPGGALIARHFPLIAELAVRFRLPSISGDRAFSEAGGLLFYGAGYAGQLHRAATYVDKVLKGVKPAELPVEQPTKPRLV